MDDSGAPGVSTPEHWSDVGPLSGRLQLVEQQVQQVQVGWEGMITHPSGKKGPLERRLRHIGLNVLFILGSPLGGISYSGHRHAIKKIPSSNFLFLDRSRSWSCDTHMNIY